MWFIGSEPRAKARRSVKLRGRAELPRSGREPGLDETGERLHRLIEFLEMTLHGGPVVPRRSASRHEGGADPVVEVTRADERNPSVLQSRLLPELRKVVRQDRNADRGRGV